MNPATSLLFHTSRHTKYQIRNTKESSGQIERYQVILPRLPEDAVVPGRQGTHIPGGVLEDLRTDLEPRHLPVLEQLWVPNVALAQHAMEKFLRGCLHLRRDAPEPQGMAVADLLVGHVHAHVCRVVDRHPAAASARHISLQTPWPYLALPHFSRAVLPRHSSSITQLRLSRVRVRLPCAAILLG
jgi:hypothetical protein